MKDDRLQKQLNFLYEIDKLKTIFRRNNLIADVNRLENTAEHSWHLALYVLILSEYRNTEINLLQVIKMVLLHDLVEIDAGDTFCYDEEANTTKQEREKKAAKRLFGLLPIDQQQEFLLLWEEFEANETADAKFANCIDRLQPLLHNYVTGGGSWKRHNITRQQVEARMKPIAEGSLVFEKLMSAVLEESVKNNFLKC